jgi:hypothetical protein
MCVVPDACEEMPKLILKSERVFQLEDGQVLDGHDRVREQHLQ